MQSSKAKCVIFLMTEWLVFIHLITLNKLRFTQSVNVESIEHLWRTLQPWSLRANRETDTFTISLKEYWATEHIYTDSNLFPLPEYQFKVPFLVE